MCCLNLGFENLLLIPGANAKKLLCFENSDLLYHLVRKIVVQVLQYYHFEHLKIGQEVVAVDKRYFRPTEVDLLLGDPSKAEKELGWNREFDLKDLVNDMMESDLKLMRKDVYLKEGGYKIMRYFE